MCCFYYYFNTIQNHIGQTLFQLPPQFISFLRKAEKLIPISISGVNKGVNAAGTATNFAADEKPMSLLILTPFPSMRFLSSHCFLGLLIT